MLYRHHDVPILPDDGGQTCIDDSVEMGGNTGTVGKVYPFEFDAMIDGCGKDRYIHRFA